MKLTDLLSRFLRDDRGMETVEWAILAALITAGIVTAITTLGTNIQNAFNNLASNTTPKSS